MSDYSITKEHIDGTEKMGRLAYRKGKSMSDNPFSILELRDAWEDGWKDAKAKKEGNKK